MEKKLYTVLQASVETKKSPATIYTMIKAGELNVMNVKKGNRTTTMLPQEEVDKIKNM